MAAALAHQMRTPLSAALLYASNLAARDLPVDKRTEFLSRLLDRLRRMEQLIEDMLALARSCRLSNEPLDVPNLWADFRAEIADDQQEGEFRIDWCGQAPQGRLLGNRSALFSIMGNLINNAREICGGRGRLGISIDVIKSAILVICFSDDGPGIADGDCERIFEPFYSTREGGTGLGLAVARAVAVAHGGSLRAEACGSGAQFVLSLPLQRDAAPPDVVVAEAEQELACG
jgi:two-component system sensor histidine kinase FlrB